MTRALIHFSVAARSAFPCLARALISQNPPDPAALLLEQPESLMKVFEVGRVIVTMPINKQNGRSVNATANRAIVVTADVSSLYEIPNHTFRLPLQTG